MSGPASPELEELVFQCLERLEGEGPAALDSLCAAHPEHADALRRRIAGLRAAGLVASGSETEPEFPERLGGFRLLERLGAGGMGVVYLAEETALGREVALKLIRPDQLYFPGARERFQREVQVAARLAHPGIVPVYSVGEEAGIPYYAMEVVAGPSLAELLDAFAGRDPRALEGQEIERFVRGYAGLPEAAPGSSPPLFRGGWVEVALEIARQVAAALEFAHRHGVLHRDVKPSNVMLDPLGRALLCDFGLASSRGTDRLTRTGSWVGSLPYVPPEQLTSEPAEAHERGDLYSLGVTLFELMTLESPFADKAAEQTMLRIHAGRCRRPRELNPRIPPDAETVCLTAMEVDPARRYADAAALARDLTNVLERRPIEARPAGAWVRARRWAQRHPGWATAAGLGLAVAVGGPTAFGLQQRAARVEVEAQKGEAELQRLLAEADFQRALEALDLLTQVGEEELEDVPRAGEARRRMLEAALGFHLELLAARGARPELLEGTARAYHSAGKIQLGLGRSGEAEASLRAAIARYEALPAPSAAILRRTSDACARLALLLDRTGRRAEALEQNERAIGLIEGCADGADGTLEDRVELARRRRQRATLLRTAGHPAETRQLVLQVRADLEALAAETDVRMPLASTLDELAHTWIDLQDWPSSCEPLRAAVELLEPLRAERPGDRDVAEALLRVRSNLGTALIEADVPEGAEEQLVAAAALAEELVRDYPGVPGYREQLMTASTNLGTWYGSTGRLERSLDPQLRAIEVGERLVAEHPDDVQLAAVLVTIKPNLAGAFLNLGQLEDARAVLDEALAEAALLHERFPSDPTLRQAVRECHLNGARIYAALGLHAEAVELAVTTPYMERAVFCRVACAAVAQCARAAREDPALDESEREALADEYARAAIDLARRTGEFGFEQSFLDALRHGAWAAPLRGRPEFDRLLADMTAAISGE